MLPLDHLLKGSLRVRVVRTLAFPNGNWQFSFKATGSSEGQVQLDAFAPPPELKTMREEGGDGDDGNDLLGAWGRSTHQRRGCFNPKGKEKVHHTDEDQDLRSYHAWLDNAEPLSGGKGILSTGEAPKDGGMGVSWELLPVQSAEREDGAEEHEGDGYEPGTLLPSSVE